MRFWLHLPSCSASSFIRAVNGPRKYVCSTSSPRTSPLSPAWCTRKAVCMWAWSAALWPSTPDHKVRDRREALYQLIVSFCSHGLASLTACLSLLPEFELVWCEIAAVRDRNMALNLCRPARLRVHEWQRCWRFNHCLVLFATFDPTSADTDHDFNDESKAVTPGQTFSAHPFFPGGPAPFLFSVSEYKRAIVM